MSNGELKQYLVEKYQGDIIISSIDTPVRVGGLRNPRFKKIALTTPPIKVETADKVLLDLTITTSFNPVNIKWKLLFDDFTLTREFKPQVLVEDSGTYYSKLLFDLTPIYKYQNRHVLGVQFDGAEPITIEHVNMIIFYPVEGANSSITYLSGALLLKPGEEAIVKVPMKTASGKGFIKIVSMVPSRQARIKLYFNNALIGSIEGVLGVEEITSNVEVSEENTVRIHHLPSTTKYYPNSFIVSSIIVGKTAMPLPKIVIEETKVIDNKLHIRIANKGLVEPDRLVVLVTHLGNIVYREKLRPVKPNEILDLEIPLKNIRHGEILVARIIWGRLSRTEYAEEKIKVPST